MSDAHSAVSQFIEDFSGQAQPLSDEADVFGSFGIEGDEAFDFIDRFGESFEIDVSDYRWYFHHMEEGWGIGGVLFAPPYRRVQRLPITPSILVEAVQTKRWPIRYPDHQLPKVRWDLRINQLVVVVVLVGLAYGTWRKWIA